MRTRLMPCVLLLTAVLVAGGSGLAAAATRTTAGTVQAEKNSVYGSLLVTSTGLSLYHLTAEKPGSIGCTGACAKTWPPLLLPAGAKPQAGTGVRGSKLGTIKRPDGHVQVTYNGLALYRYKLDRKAGDVKGQDVAGVWFAVTAAGKLAKTPSGGAGTPTPAPTTTTSGVSYDPGY
jgi:predicted lipoprotein with Yx(FWY)xxD motif